MFTIEDGFKVLVEWWIPKFSIFLNLNFYAVLSYVQQDSEIYFSDKASKL